MFVPTLIILIVSGVGRIDYNVRDAVAMCVVTLVGFTNLIYACRPFTLWRTAVTGLVGVLLAAGISISVVMEATLSEFNIFGFNHALDNKPFLFFMLGIGIVLSILLNFVRARLEDWFDKAITGRHKKSKKKAEKKDA